MASNHRARNDRKEENMTSKEGKNNYWKLTDNWQMLEVVKNDVKAIIVAGFHMFKKIKILETKTAISEVKLYTGWD